MELPRDLGWKVLRIYPGGKRTSTFATTGALEYPKGHCVTPHPGCGPLTLFKDYKAAKYFARLVGDVNTVAEIVPVKYEPWDSLSKGGLDYLLWEPKNGTSIRGTHLRPYGPAKTVDRVEVCIRTKRDLPMGTVLASSITCLE